MDGGWLSVMNFSNMLLFSSSNKYFHRFKVPIKLFFSTCALNWYV